MIRVALLAVVAALGCGETDDACAGPGVEPFPGALTFGDLRVEGGAVAADRRVLLLRNRCAATLAITAACVVAADDSAGARAAAARFELEPPDRTSVAAGEAGAIRVTYSPPPTPEDRDDDGAPDPDRAALVVHTDAPEASTWVIPLCGRVIGADATPADDPCATPAAVADVPEDACGR